MTRAAAVALPPTARALPLRSLVAVGVAAVAPTLVTVLRSGQDLRLALVTAAVVGGAGLSYALDDDAGVLLAASPTPLAARRALRLAVAGVVVGVAWLVALSAAAVVGLLRDVVISDLALDALVAAGIAVAAAGGVRRSLDLERVGLVGFVAGITTIAFLSVLSMRYGWLPRLGDPESRARWVWVAVLAWATVGWVSRDPARRGPHRS